jgi:alanyl aminopeptidase
MQSLPAALVLVAACGAGSSTAQTAPAAPANTILATTTPALLPPPPPAPEPPALRLPTTVHPTRNTVDLAVDPGSEAFTGTITTALTLDEPTSVIWLNGDEITIRSATVDQSGLSSAASVLTPKNGYLGLTFPKPLASGDATLIIHYSGKAHANDGDGIYRYEENGEWYAATQFEATDARQAFPTFDEPSFKVPWQLTLRVKSGLTAVSNTPVLSDRDNGDGTHTVAFAETKPLPSYLVAFVIGAWEFVDAGKTKDGIPLRIVVPRGRAGDAVYPAKVTGELLERLEDYFGKPYPYPKLDIVAVGLFNAGAMENAGIITCREALVLHKPADMARDVEEDYAGTIAHEMAHQWFGDLVTPVWWDDTWLNESFAMWMSFKIVDTWKPEWEFAGVLVDWTSYVMGQDSLDSARAIRQPIRVFGDIEAAFDGITYVKGASVLRMIERTLGEDAFSRGVRGYLSRHAWGNATYDDFVGAMSTAAGRDLHVLFDSFVKQSGIPFVSATLSCSAGQPPKLLLAQQRYVPIGSQISDADRKRIWTVPICAKWAASKDTGRNCTTLDQPTGELVLSAKTCPSWVLPNESELGYYRSRLAGADLDHLLAHIKALSVTERVGVMGDVSALVTSGDASTAIALGLATDLARDKNRRVVGASLGIVASIDELVPDNLRVNYERLIARLYKARARELGWAARPGESTDTKQLRPALVSLVSGPGKDKALIDEATALAWKWFDDRAAIQPEMVDTALAVAARYGNQKLFDRLHAAVKAATDKTEIPRLVRALGAFRDPALFDQVLALMLTNELDIQDTFTMLHGNLVFDGMRDPTLRPRVYAWFVQHFDELAQKLPRSSRPQMARVAIRFCDEAKKPEIEAFLRPRIEPLDNGPREMAQAMEQLSLCAAAHAAQAPGVVDFLKKQ